MAEEAIERPEVKEEAEAPSRELSQELALRDSLVFKKEKLLISKERYGEMKAESLRGEYQSIVDDINETSARNMSKEVDAMGEFSKKVDDFNAQCGDFIVELARLKKLAGEAE